MRRLGRSVDFGSTRFSGAVRGRQPRLAVIEYATVDARRRLLLVRRDNVEHLMMIGGPTDVVVEANIVRAAPAAVREPAAPRIPAPGENLARAIPLPEADVERLLAAAAGSSRHCRCNLLRLGRRVPRIEPISEEPISAAPAAREPIPRPQREALTALADDLSAVVPPTAPVTPLPPRSRPAPPDPIAAEPNRRSEHRVEPPRLPAGQPASDPGAADQSLAEMAQRLEAALRKPKTSELRASPTSAATAEDAEQAEEQTAAPLPPPRAARPTEAKPARAEAKPKEGKALYDTLEQEMASLLGRPANKT